LGEVHGDRHHGKGVDPTVVFWFSWVTVAESWMLFPVLLGVTPLIVSVVVAVI
jgi:hypothetical protein